MKMWLDKAENKIKMMHICGKKSSAKMIAEAVGSNMATTYRYLKELMDAGLVERTGKEWGGERRKRWMYKRKVDRIVIDFKGDYPEVFGYNKGCLMCRAEVGGEEGEKCATCGVCLTQHSVYPWKYCAQCGFVLVKEED